MKEKNKILDLILKKDLEEIYENNYIDVFQNILTFSEEEFFNQMEDQITINLKILKKSCRPQLNSMYRDLYLIKYRDDISKIKKDYNKLQQIPEKNLTYLNYTNCYIHCYKNLQAIHICGNQLIKYNNYIFCLQCKKVYPENQVKLFCTECQKEYFSKIKNTNLQRFLPVAFANNHCENIKNEKIICLKCGNELYYSIEKNNKFNPETCGILEIYCYHCKIKYDMQKTKFNCNNCNELFSSEAKLYNDFPENKIKLLNIINILILKKNALPKNFEKKICDCDITKVKEYIHNKLDKGILYSDKMDNFIVCNKCYEIFDFNKFEFCCPKCYIKFGVKRWCLKKKFDRNKENNKLGNSATLFEKKCYKPIRNVKKDFKKINTNPSNTEEDIENDSKNLNDTKSIRHEKKIKKKKLFVELRDTDLTTNKMITVSSEKLLNRYKNKKCETTEKNDKKYINNNIISKVLNEDKKNGIKKKIDIKEIEKYFLESDIGPKKNRNVIHNINNFIRVDVINNNNNNIIGHIHNNNDYYKKIPKRKVIQNLNPTPILFSQRNQLISMYNNNFKTLNNNQNDDNDCFKYLECLGTGSYGNTYLVEDNKTHLKYALKKLTITSSLQLRENEEQYNTLLQLGKNHPEIKVARIFNIKTKYVDGYTAIMYILMEVANCDWEKELLNRRNYKAYYTEKEILNILFLLVDTLAELQKIGICHRDIKPQNILCFGRKGYKISDFGEAKYKKNWQNQKRHSLRGTQLYMSPLLYCALKKRQENYIEHNPFKSDVFSLGMCFLFAGSLDFEYLYDIRAENIVKVVQKCIGNRYSNKFIRIILRMLDIDEKMRPDFLELRDIIDNMMK